MARLSRVCPVGVPQHVIQRGNNRQVCFADEQDFAAYAHWLQETSRKYQVDVHAWVFMTNHIHLLCTPHALYRALGNEESERQARYQQLFKQHVEGALLTEIRQTLNKGLALGNERFKAEIEKLTGRRVTARKAGRPVGWRKKDKVHK